MSRSKSRWVVAAVTLLVLASTGCARLAPVVGVQSPGDDDLRAESSAGPAAAGELQSPEFRSNRTAATGRQTVIVSRGHIAELLPLSGRVVGQEELTLSLGVAGRVETVAVKPGQAVEKGQILLQTDSNALAKDLDEARTRLEVSSLRLAQARGQARSRQQDVIAEADAALQRALANQERVSRGPDPAEVTKAEQEVARTRLALRQAEAEQANLTRGPDPAEVRKAEQDVAQARQALQKAEAEQDRLARGGDTVDVLNAERELIKAQVELDRVQAEADRLMRGPDPNAVQAVERELERAQSALQQAQSAPATDAASRASRAASIASASTARQEAQERLARLQEGPSRAEVETARRNVQLAQLAVDGARERLETARRGPGQPAIEAARTATDNANAVLQQAEARLAALQAGPRPDPAQAAVAASNVEVARAAVRQAEARLAELRSSPKADEVRAANDQVARARAAAQRARAQSGPAEDEADAGKVDLLLLQKGVDQDQAKVQALEQAIAATRLMAPAAGTVVSVSVRDGDNVEAKQPVVVLATQGAALVRAGLSSADAARVTVGQKATVQLDGEDSAPLDATVASLVETGNNGRVALFQVDWGGSAPSFGTPAKVAVAVREKDNVLLVPERAVRTVGSRQYVEYHEGSARRTITVEVGIVADGKAEILSGLQEGQAISVRP